MQTVSITDPPAALVSQAEKVSLPFDTSPIRKEEFDAVLADTHGYIRSIVCSWGPVLRRMGSSVDDATNDMVLFAYHIREKISFDRVSHFLKECQTREEAVRRAFLALMKTSVHRKMINHTRDLKNKNRTFARTATDEVHDKLERKIGREPDPFEAAIFDEMMNHPEVRKLEAIQNKAEAKNAHRRYVDRGAIFQRRELAYHLLKSPGDVKRNPRRLARKLGINPTLCARWLGWAQQHGVDLFLKNHGVKPMNNEDPKPVEKEPASQPKPVEGQPPSPKPKPLSARQFLEGQRLKPVSVVDPDIVAAACGCRRRTAMIAIRSAGHIVKGSRVTEPREPSKPAKAPRSRPKRPKPRVEEKAAPWVNFEAIRETVSAGWGIARGFLGRLGSMLTKPKAPAVPVKPRSRRPKSR